MKSFLGIKQQTTLHESKSNSLCVNIAIALGRSLFWIYHNEIIFLISLSFLNRSKIQSSLVDSYFFSILIIIFIFHELNNIIFILIVIILIILVLLSFILFLCGRLPNKSLILLIANMNRYLIHLILSPSSIFLITTVIITIHIAALPAATNSLRELIPFRLLKRLIALINIIPIVTAFSITLWINLLFFQCRKCPCLL